MYELNKKIIGKEYKWLQVFLHLFKFSKMSLNWKKYGPECVYVNV